MMLPAIDHRTLLGPDAISYSELSTLGQCEQKHVLSYGVEREPSEPTKAMALGTEMHRLIQLWWRTGEVAASENDTAAWLIKRYVEHYSDNRLKAELVAVEQSFATPLPWGGYVFGFIDLVLRIEGDIWLGEIKTMGRDSMSYLRNSHQLTIYQWAMEQAAEQFGGPTDRPRGVLLDGILTQRIADVEEGAAYKSGPRKGQLKKRPTVADSFRREWITRSPQEIQRALGELFAACMVRRQLRAQIRPPIRNIGQACSYCFFAAECLGETVELLPED